MTAGEVVHLLALLLVAAIAVGAVAVIVIAVRTLYEAQRWAVRRLRGLPRRGDSYTFEDYKRDSTR